MTNDRDDLQQCEVFLRAVLEFSSPDTSDGMWTECRRHEWQGWVWDSELEKMVRILPVIDLEAKP